MLSLSVGKNCSLNEKTSKKAPKTRCARGCLAHPTLSAPSLFVWEVDVLSLFIDTITVKLNKRYLGCRLRSCSNPKKRNLGSKSRREKRYSNGSEVDNKLKSTCHVTISAFALTNFNYPYHPHHHAPKRLIERTRCRLSPWC